MQAAAKAKDVFWIVASSEALDGTLNVSYGSLGVPISKVRDALAPSSEFFVKPPVAPPLLLFHLSSSWRIDNMQGGRAASTGLRE